MNENIKPDLVFALGLGDKPVDEYGRFVVKQVYKNRVDQRSIERELKVVLCDETEYFESFEHVENKEVLYCLEDYSSYAVKGDKTDVSMYNLKITFEICNTSSRCRLNALQHLSKHSFRFPHVSQFFFPAADGDSDGMLKRLD